MQNLKSKYEQKKMRVSDGLWDRLEDKLSQAGKEEKPKIIWWKYAAVILLMIGLSGSFWMLNHKSDMKENQEFVNQTESENQNFDSHVIETSENNEVGKVNPINNNSEADNQRLAVENVNPSTSESINKENQTTNQVFEKEITIKKDEISIPQPEEKLAQNEIQKPKERTKYITSSDLLFGVEMDRAKTETPKSAMGINISKSRNDSDFPNPKRIKIFGITLYDKDSTTTK
jgi:lipopolysaccharide export system protein LptC